MLYKFKSKATGDLIMMAEHAEPLLRMMGKEVSAKGIVLHEDLALVIERLQEGLLEHGMQASANTDRSQGQGHEHLGVNAPDLAISLKVRAQPMLKMLRMAQSENADVLWGV